MAPNLPKKLTTDTIVEALLEVQFETSELSELAIGRLAAFPQWQRYPAVALPASNIPAALRRADPNMGRLPILEKREAGSAEFGRIGDRAISLHRQRPYSGWENFGPKCHELLSFVYASGLADLKVTRLGLRYVNAFTEKDHGIKSLSELELTMAVGPDQLGARAMLYFERRSHEDMIAQVKIASKELIANPTPNDLAVFVDVDVILPPEAGGLNEEAAHQWLERAHTQEKIQYFSLYTKDMMKRLVES